MEDGVGLPGQKSWLERNVSLSSADFDVSKIQDERLICALVEANLPFLRRRAARFSGKNVVLDQDDLVQEAAIGFIRAVATFDPEKNVAFRQYATLCVDRRLISVCQSQARQKRGPSAEVVSLSEERLEAQRPVLREEQVCNPEELVIIREGFQNFLKRLEASLSRLEREVLALYLYGYSLSEVSSRLGLTAKQVDNAMQRVRRKCRHLLAD